VTCHHVIFRSRGGGEDKENLVSLCSACHLELVHAKGTLAVQWEDGQLVWYLGRHARLKVTGRVVRGVVAAEDAASHRRGAV
jgi:5-methylcytosine-specific restriction endonuclease McrA